MNWLEISIGIIFLICIITGLIRGAVRIIVSLVATIVTLVIVFFATPYVSQTIEKYTPLDDMIRQKVVSTMADAATSAVSGGDSYSDKGGLTEEAVKKVTVGLEKKTRVYSEKDKKLTAYHEAGHAVVSRYLPTQTDVKEVSIIPRGVAGGYTMYKSDEDKYYISKTEMKEKLIALLGGRAAEKLVLDDISTGASNDIEVATRIAREMVTKYGMSDNLGPIDFQGKEQNDMFVFGENIGDKIGAEVKSLIDEAYNNAQKLLIEHRDKLDAIAQTLLAQEKINEQEFKEIFGE